MFGHLSFNCDKLDVMSKKTSGKSNPVAKPWEHAKGTEGSMNDPLAARFVESISYDRRLYPHDIAGSIAHARMLRDAGLIDAKELRQIEEGLAAIEKEIDEQADAWPGWKVELEDVHMCIEAALIEKAGDAGRKLHTGRSRNDQVALDLKLWCVDAAVHIIARLDALCDAFARLAEKDGDVVMPSYTHLQRAQPIAAGGELMAWLAAFERSANRIKLLHLLNDELPLGGGAIAGSSLPLNRPHVAEALGFGGIALSSIDATASRDVAVDFLYGLAMVAMNLSRWAEQWIIYASTEFSFIKLDGRYTTGSSMMPQKRNPDMLELIRGRTGGVYGQLVAILTILKGLPIGYNRDLQEDKRLLFDAYDRVLDSLDMAQRIVSTTRFKPDIITHGLDHGFLDATSLAEYLVTRGVPFRTSHQIVGSLVRLCESKNLHSLAQLDLKDFQQACTDAGCQADVCAQDVFDWLGAASVVRRYQSLGNAGVSGYRTMLGQWKAKKNKAGRKKKGKGKS
jgi:argininosuccinate lyase